MASATVSAVTGAATVPTQLAPFSGTEGTYMLPHHAQEIERLHRQHLFMNTTTGGLLLVVPSIHEKKSLRVLDSGAADAPITRSGALWGRHWIGSLPCAG
ncbi:hypothetical protein LB505_012948 [Fusarium chuoi]|nr:hypothetical protein LB505_012948 [Fusarium chuoi]